MSQPAIALSCEGVVKRCGTVTAVQVLGMRWATDAAALRPRLGIQLQETPLADKLTVEETLRLFRSFYPSGPTVGELLNRFRFRVGRRTTRGGNAVN